MQWWNYGSNFYREDKGNRCERCQWVCRSMCKWQMGFFIVRRVLLHRPKAKPHCLTPCIFYVKILLNCGRLWQCSPEKGTSSHKPLAPQAGLWAPRSSMLSNQLPVLVSKNMTKYKVAWFYLFRLLSFCWLPNTLDYGPKWSNCEVFYGQ